MGEFPGWLRDELAVYGVDDSDRRSLHGRLWHHYESRGLVRDGEPLPIQGRSTSEHRCVCNDEDLHEDGRKWGISLPWIGAAFSDQRILVLAENIRGDGDGGPMTQHFIVKRLSEYLAGGEGSDNPEPFKPRFFMRTLQAVTQLARARRGSTLLEWVSYHDRLWALDQITLLEAIKCQTDSSPAGWMWQTCPERIGLMDEVALLEPRVLMALGSPTARLIDDLYNLESEGDGFRSVTTDAGWGACEFLLMPHPSDRRNWNSRAQLPLERHLAGMSSR